MYLSGGKLFERELNIMKNLGGKNKYIYIKKIIKNRFFSEAGFMYYIIKNRISVCVHSNVYWKPGK